MGKKILVILTSADKIPKANNAPTGWYLPELAHPYYVLASAGFDMDVMAPLGGKTPLDQGSVTAFAEDEDCKKFLKDAKAQQLVNNAKKPSEVNAGDYAAVLYPGGHGPMFDLATDKNVAKIAAEIYEKGGVVAAVCHGPAALVPIQLSNGEPLVKGKEFTCFSNEEEAAVNLTDAMPFSLETKLVEQGGKFKKAANWQECVVVDSRLVTGQNPASSKNLAHIMVKLLK